MKRLFIPLSMALLIHFILLDLPIGPKLAAPAHRRNRQTISLSLFRYTSPPKVIKPKLQPPSQNETRPKLQPLSKPIIQLKPEPVQKQNAVSKLEPFPKASSAPVLKPAPEPQKTAETLPPVVKQALPAKDQVKDPLPTKIEP